VEEQDLDVMFPHQVDERVVLLPRAADPDDVVEEQLVAVRRRQALVREVRPVHDHRPQRPDLGAHAEGGFGDCGHVDSFQGRVQACSDGRGTRSGGAAVRGCSAMLRRICAGRGRNIIPTG
jgi:hypothetical protein